MGFKGFDRIAKLEYAQKTFLCGSCENQCDVTQVVTEDGSLYYGDRCERYSGASMQRSSSLQNPFDVLSRMVESYTPILKGREKVGIPRVGMFYDLLPLWSTFFYCLDLDVVSSDKTNKKIIREGLEKSTAEFCYPFKVAFGHYANLNGKVGFVFSPDIVQGFRSCYSSNGKVRYTAWDRSRTCPYIQNFGSVVANNVSEGKVINPHLSLREGHKNVVEELFLSLGSVGLNFSKREVSDAFSTACNVHKAFKANLMYQGKKTLEGLVEKQKGIVIVGRPYSAYDDEMNLRLSRKILDYGLLPLPMGFIPLPKLDLSERWTNEFSIQGQLILNSASVIRELGLNAVFLDYFGCGPNSFLKHFFAKELGKPFLTLQIDEHTADAGLVTRLEAFLDCIR